MCSRALLVTFFVLTAGLTANAQEITGSSRLPSDARQAVVKKVKPLGCTGLRTGIISEPGLSAGFTFQGTLGDVVDLVLVEVIGFESSFPIATVESPTEGVLGVLNGTTLQNFVLPETAQYQITVTASAAGAFRIGRFCWPPTVAADGFLSCGDVLSETLDKPGDLDYFVFAGQLNDDVQISLVETAGFASSAARGTLFSPTGVELVSLDADNVLELSLPETGNYTLRVRANDLNGVGAYNVGLSCFPPLNPILLSCGMPPQMLTINDPGEVFFFTFDGGVDDVIEITLAGTGDAVPTMRIVDPLGSFVGSFNSDSLTGIRLGTTGSYTVEVRASTLADLGPFSIALACRAPLGPATAIACGGNVSGSLGSVGEFDFYTFPGIAGDTGELTLTATAGFPGTSAPRMRVFTPSGTNLGAFEGDTVNPIALPETGTYTVRVTSNTLVDTGTYTLALACLPPSGSTHLGDDVNFPGDISAPGEMDFFTFEGETGEVVEIPLVVTSGFAGTVCRGTLRAPSSTVVGTFDADSLTEFTLPETGTFTFEILAVNLISTGAYRCGLERRANPGGGPDEDPESPSLVCDQLIAGSIDLAGQVDYFRFDASSGDVIELTLTSGAFTAGARLFSPSNVDLGGFFANSLNAFTLTETGQYSVRIAASNLVGTGSYWLGFECRVPLGPVEANLVCGDIAAETIISPSETDYFAFQASAGDTVELTLTSGGFTANARLFSPSNVDLGGFFANTINAFTLTETGQYAVRVIASGLVGTGSYWLGFECRDPVAPVEAHLVCGDIYPGTIDGFSEVDNLTFDAFAGDAIELTLTSGGFTANARLFSPSNVDLGGFFANTINAFTLPETGQYSVRVLASSLVGTGSYWLGFECRDPVAPVEAQLACGDIYPGTIDGPSEVDNLTFVASAGNTIELTLTSGGFTANARLFSPSNVDLGGFFANTLNAFTLTETGQYSVRVLASSLVGTGSYWLGFECRDPVAPVQAHLDCGDIYAGTIDGPSEVDNLTFDASAGDTIELILTSGGFTANARLFSPSNVDLGAFFANSLNAFTLTETGQYSVRVLASGLFGTGSYWLGFECRAPLGPVEAHLACGDVAAETITGPSEVDYFTFDGTNGDTIELTLTSGGFTANARLFSPSNVDLGGFFANSLNPFNLTETGQYSVRVIASNLVGTGSYNLGLGCP